MESLNVLSELQKISSLDYISFVSNGNFALMAKLKYWREMRNIQNHPLVIAGFFILPQFILRKRLAEGIRY